MNGIKDSSKSSVLDLKADMGIRTDYVKKLDQKETETHYIDLGKMLRLLSRFVYEKLPASAGSNNDLQRYLLDLSGTLEALVLKTKIESMKPNSDIAMANCIGSIESGFPIYVRDLYFLTNDKQVAQASLKELPKDEELVDDALFSLRRGVLPTDVILQKYQRDYFQKLSEAELPSQIRSHHEIFRKERDKMKLFRKSIERFHEHDNIPRFYTLYFKVPNQTAKSEYWKEDLEEAIRRGFSTVSSLEMPSLARGIDDVEGVMLERLDRFDIGPFYNRFTQNNEVIQRLLDECKQSIIIFREYSVQRMAEREREGLTEKFKSWFSGENTRGIFSPVIVSPVYALMPHRMIQKVHFNDLDLGKDIRMYGITEDGGLID